MELTKISAAYPAQRIAEFLRHEAQIEPLLEWVTGHAAKTFRERFGIAMQAAGADFRAAANRISCRIRPFDF